MIRAGLPPEEAAQVAQMPRRSVMARLWQRLSPSRRPEDRTNPALEDGNLFYGWFEPDNGPPACNPPDGGPCILCGHRIDGIPTLHILAHRVERTYFYLTHTSCSQALNDDPLHLIDAENAIAGMIERNGD